MKSIIAVVNQKGGVGKTTTCVNVAATLVETGDKVLLIDLDPQGNATTGSGVKKDQIRWHTGDVLLGRIDFAKAILKHTTAGYDLLPANIFLSGAEIDLIKLENPSFQLQKTIKNYVNRYDYIIIDCPPSLTILTTNGLIGAHCILIPVQCEFFALEGLVSLLNTIKQVKLKHNPTLNIVGVLRTMFDARVSLTKHVSKQLEDFFGDILLKTVIPRNIRLAEAPSFGLPALKYDRLSKGALSYLAVTKELKGKLISIN